MATISSIVVEIKANAAKLKQGIAKATAGIKKFAATVAKVGAGITAAIGVAAVAAFVKLYSAIKRTSDALDETIKFADNIGISIRSFQRLQFQAEQSGISADKLKMSMQQMLRVAGEAAEGSQRASRAFERMGISLNDIKNLNTEQLLKRIFEGLKSIESGAIQASTANVLFGRNWQAMLNLVRSDTRETAAQFEKLGIGISQLAGKKIQAFNDARNRMSKIWKSFLNNLTVETAPAFTKIIEYIEKTANEFGGMGNVAKSFARGVIKGLMAAVEAVQTFGLALMKLTSIFDRLGNAQRKLVLLMIQVKKAFSEKDQLDIIGDLKSGTGLLKRSSKYTEMENMSKLIAKDIVEVENRIKSNEKSWNSFFSTANKGLKKVSSELQILLTDTPESIAGSLGQALFEELKPTKKLFDSKELKKISEDSKKTKDSTKAWKDKLQQANQELMKSQGALDQIQNKMGEIQGGKGFAEGISSLSNVLITAEKASSYRDAQALRGLFEKGQRAFFEGDYTGKMEKQQVEIKLTVDKDGVITPVVESQKFDNAVVTIVGDVMNKQARIIDR